MNEGYKFRIYPSAEQKIMFAKTFGCVRFVYNRMLSDKLEKKKSVTPAQYKDEFKWLREVDSLALCNAQMNLKRAFENQRKNGWFACRRYAKLSKHVSFAGKTRQRKFMGIFFDQPLRIGLEQAYGGENVILSKTGIIASCPNDGISFYEKRNNELTEWRMFVKIALLKIKPALHEEILATRVKLFAPNDHVLGVLLRGTDYVAKIPKWHPIPPPLEFAASVVVEKLQEWQCNKIFLAMEDKNILQIFKKVFGDLCVTFDRECIDYIPGK